MLNELLAAVPEIVAAPVILAVFFLIMFSAVISALKKLAMNEVAAVLGNLLVMAIGLNAMGIADTIVHLAFGLTLGAIAVAVALSFGLWGREAAGKRWSIS